MIARSHYRALQLSALLAIGILFFNGHAHAAGSGMPWEAPLTQILASIEGPVARIVAVIIIIITGGVLGLSSMSVFLLLLWW